MTRKMQRPDTSPSNLIRLPKTRPLTQTQVILGMATAVTTGRVHEYALTATHNNPKLATWRLTGGICFVLRSKSTPYAVMDLRTRTFAYWRSRSWVCQQVENLALTLAAVKPPYGDTRMWKFTVFPNSEALETALALLLKLK